MNWIKKIHRMVENIVFAILIFALTLEFFSFLLSYYHLLPFNDTPPFYNHSNQVIPYTNWRTESSPWGPWHQKNSTTWHRTSCFNAKYSSNEVGARDGPFINAQDPRKNYVLIGDSFAEGYGVNYEETAQKIIEDRTGLNILNFGTANDFGPVQYSIIYEKLASKFAHDGLIIFFLPDNDFLDNDYKAWGKIDRFKHRWRPYFKKEEDGKYTYFIPKTAFKRNDLINPSPKFRENYLWFNNVFNTYKLVLKRSKLKKVMPQESGYFRPSIEQEEASIFFINKIIKKTKAKKIFLVSIPRPLDIADIASGKDKKQMLWYKAFQDASKQNKKNVIFIDLADYIKNENVSDLFFQCDGHWSTKGNKWAAEIISSKINAIK